jgi:hypothetical protein
VAMPLKMVFFMVISLLKFVAFVVYGRGGL